MRKTLVLFLLCCTAALQSQNLAENGSLENTGNCPIISPNFEDFLAPWTFYYGQPDYYHPCGFAGSDSSTNNTLPFDGDGFAGIRVFGDTGAQNYLRDYLHGELSQPLDSGKLYRVTFYVKPLNYDTAGVSIGIENMGMLITDSVIDTVPQNNVLPYRPQIQSSNVITEDDNWTAVCGIFRAKGGEEYFTIGNFNTDFETNFLPLEDASNPQTAYYMVDYVEVVENDIPQLPPDTVICKNGRIDLVIDRPGSTVEWNDESTDPRFIVTKPGTYWATITNGFCEYTDTIKVEPIFCAECEVYVPNAFTPNDDGLNEKFEVFPNCAPEGELLEFSMRIFDRWGQKIFQSNSHQVSWDGGDAVSGSQFTYVIQYTYSQGRETRTDIQKGSFTLIR